MLTCFQSAEKNMNNFLLNGFEDFITGSGIWILVGCLAFALLVAVVFLILNIRKEKQQQTKVGPLPEDKPAEKKETKTEQVKEEETEEVKEEVKQEPKAQEKKKEEKKEVKNF